jgi:hypothetical protein
MVHWQWFLLQPEQSLPPILDRIAVLDEETVINVPWSILKVSLSKELATDPRPEYSDWCELDAMRSDLERATGVQIELLSQPRDFSWNVTGKPCRPENAYGILRLVRNVSTPLRSYQPHVLRERIGLRTVLICEDLRLKGVPIKGTTEFKSGTLFLSHDIENFVDPGPGWSNMVFHCVHHEIFHLIEGKFQERLADEFKYWETLHGNSWKFGTHAIDSATATRMVESARVKYRKYDRDKDGLLDFDAPVMNNPRFRILGDGLLTSYSKGSVREDRAELYSALMHSPVSRKLAFEAAENDLLLHTKLRLLESTLAILLRDASQ